MVCTCAGSAIMDHGGGNEVGIMSSGARNHRWQPLAGTSLDCCDPSVDVWRTLLPLTLATKDAFPSAQGLDVIAP